MKKLLQRIVSTISILALFLCIFLRPVPARAATPSSTPAVTASSVTSYSFNAKAGDSLSRIVRRALQLRGVTDQPTAMYCENTITAQLGNEYLEVSQQVVVSYAQIDACISAGKGLDATQRAAWQMYANNVVFDVSDINPTNNSSDVVTPPAPAPAAPAPKTPAQPTSPTTSTPAPAPVTTKKQAKKTSADWWYAIAAALAITYFILDGPMPRRRSRS